MQQCLALKIPQAAVEIFANAGQVVFGFVSERHTVPNPSVVAIKSSMQAPARDDASDLAVCVRFQVFFDLEFPDTDETVIGNTEKHSTVQIDGYVKDNAFVSF